MNTAAAKKLKMMDASVQCLVFGMLGFLPGIGVPFAVVSMISDRVRRMEAEFWNPGKTYRLIGSTCAMFGTVMWLVVAALIGLMAVNNANSGSLD